MRKSEVGCQFMVYCDSRVGNSVILLASGVEKTNAHISGLLRF